MERAMVGSGEDREFRKRMERIETLIHEVEHFPDPKARTHTREIIQAILDLHGAALERALEKIAATGETGLAMIDSLAADDLVGSLLLLYGLHPQDTETRVRQALDKVRPYLRSHGGNVELLGVAGGMVRLRMQGSCEDCPSSAATLKRTIEEAIYDKAPDVTAIEVEEAAGDGQPVGNGRARMALPILRG
jgi:Fe-S cluster biogenesis protein NfuA